MEQSYVLSIVQAYEHLFFARMPHGCQELDTLQGRGHYILKLSGEGICADQHRYTLQMTLQSYQSNFFAIHNNRGGFPY